MAPDVLRLLSGHSDTRIDTESTVDSTQTVFNQAIVAALDPSQFQAVSNTSILARMTINSR